MTTMISGLDFTEDLAGQTTPRRTILSPVATVVRLTPLADRRMLAEDLALVTNTPLLSCGWEIRPVEGYTVLEGYGATITLSPETLERLISSLLH